MIRALLIPLPLLLAACGSVGTDTDAEPGNAVATVAPQPGNAVEEIPAGEGAAAGAPESDQAVVMNPDANAAGPITATSEADYLGRWVGVEGMILTVARKPGGGVRIDNQWDLDNRGTFDGSVTAEGLRFMRNGTAVTAVPSDGDATGLKWLAGKRDCLTVKPGEGYCRD